MMDSLHDVLRSIRPETKAKDHLSVFREFLAHLGELQRRRPRPDATPRKPGRATAR
jgi:hypothetical protein